MIDIDSDNLAPCSQEKARLAAVAFRAMKRDQKDRKACELIASMRGALLRREMDDAFERDVKPLQASELPTAMSFITPGLHESDGRLRGW